MKGSRPFRIRTRPALSRAYRCGSAARRPSAARRATDARCSASRNGWRRGRSCFLGRRLEDAGNDVGHPIPVARLPLEMSPACGGQPIEARLALVLGFAPLALDEPLVLEPIEGRIERALLDFEAGGGGMVDTAQD